MMLTTTTTFRVLAASVLLACAACNSDGGDGVAGTTAAPTTAAPTTVAPTTAAPASTVPQLQSGAYTIDVNGTQREYRLYVPASAGSGSALVLAFHGWEPGESAERMESYSGLDQAADNNHFVVAYPQGTVTADSGGLPFWDVGYDIQKERIDDIGFARALQAFLVERLHLNEERVYATGFSNGADFVYRLACSGEPWLAAIAPVAGSMMLEMQRTCRPHGPTSVISIAGTADTANLWDGDPENKVGFGAYSSQDGDMHFWAKNNGLTGFRGLELDKSDFVCAAGFDNHKDGGLQLPTWTEWSDASGYVKVQFARWEGMPHVWPSECAAVKISSFLMSHLRGR
jgi:poly(3-hydroxybutyrate) depolymerase